MSIPFSTSGDMSPVQIVLAYSGVIFAWWMMAAMIGHSARVFMGVRHGKMSIDVGHAVIGGIIVFALLRYFNVSISELVFQIAPQADAELVWFAEIAVPAFFGACGLRLFAYY